MEKNEKKERKRKKMRFSYQSHSQKDDGNKVWHDETRLPLHLTIDGTPNSITKQRTNGGSSGLVQRAISATTNHTTKSQHLQHGKGNHSTSTSITRGNKKRNLQLRSSMAGSSNTNNVFRFILVPAIVIIIIFAEWKVYQWSKLNSSRLVSNQNGNQNGLNKNDALYQVETIKDKMILGRNTTHRNTHTTQSTSQHQYQRQQQSPYLYDTNLHLSLDSILQKFPLWIQNYVRWHQEQRRKFPGMQLFEHPDAPPLLIRTCLGVCGGLHDRIGQLPWDIYLANVTGRVLLLSWQRPRAIEEFLIPNHHYNDYSQIFQGGSFQSSLPQILLDWRVPKEAHAGFNDMSHVRDHWTPLFQGMPEDHPTADFWNYDVDRAIQRATGGGTTTTTTSITDQNSKNGTESFQHIKILRHRLLGHLGERDLEERLVSKHGESVQAAQALHTTETFGNLFWLFFRPNPNVEDWFHKVIQPFHMHDKDDQEKAIKISAVQQVDPKQQEQLEQEQRLQSYIAVHCRVRHPKAMSTQLLGKNPKYPADKTGLPWEGETRQFAIDQAQQALQCAADITKITSSLESSSFSSSVYFLSDSNDLVRHVAFELTDPKYTKIHDENQSSSVFGTDVNSALYQLVANTTSTTTTATTAKEHQQNEVQQKVQVHARDVSEETAHLDRQKGRPASAYWATFVDLLMVAHADCVVYGVGYYAAFGAKIGKSSMIGNGDSNGNDLLNKKCQYIYQKEAWGAQVPKAAQTCPAPKAAS